MPSIHDIPRLMKQRDPGLSSHSDRFSLHLSYAILLAGLFVMLFVRVRFLSVPLERDEGEYAYAAQLMLNGINPYRFCYTMKLPGTAAAYAAFMALFGQSVTAIHCELLLVNLTTSLLLYFLGRRLMGPLAGAVTAVSFALLSLGGSALGLAGHATHFVVLTMVAGLLLLLNAIDSRRPVTFFLSGLLFGMSILMKQPGAFFAVFAFLFLAFKLYHASRSLNLVAGRCVLFSAGVLLPFGMTCLLFLASGSFPAFWFWVYDYANTYSTIVHWYDAVILLKYQFDVVMAEEWPLMALAVTGAIALVWHRPLRRNAVFIGGFLLISWVAFSIGLHFRRHYFVLMLPALSLACACGIEGLIGLWQRRCTLHISQWLAVLFFALVSFATLFLQKDYFFANDPEKAFAALYFGNPFSELVPISAYIKARSSPSDTIVVMGSDPEIYFYTARRSGTGYVYMYPLMEEQPFATHMQKEMMKEIEASRPKFMVFITTRLAWLVQPGSDKSIIGWSEHYVHDHYKMVGLSENLNGVVKFHWQDAEHYESKSPFAVYIFERID